MMISRMVICVNRFFEIFWDTPFGHTFGVRVDVAAPRGLWPPAGGGLCRRVVKEKVLRIDRPDGRRVLKFDGAFGPEGCGLPLCGNAYKVSVTGLAFCIIWYDKHSGD